MKISAGPADPYYVPPSLSARVIAALPKPLRAPVYVVSEGIRHAVLPGIAGGFVGALVGGVMAGPIGAMVGFATGATPIAGFVGIYAGGFANAEVNLYHMADYQQLEDKPK